MKKYYIDFEGYLTIEAEDNYEALDRFWEIMNKITCKNQIAVEGVEEAE